MSAPALFMWLVVAVAAVGWAWMILQGAVALVHRRYARQEYDAAEASGDLDTLRDLIRPVVEDEVNLRLVWSRPEVTPLDAHIEQAMRLGNTPLHDELAVARFRRQLDEGRTQ